MAMYVIVDLKMNAEFEKKYHMPIGYGYYEEVIFDDFDEALEIYDTLMCEAPEGAEKDNIVLEMHEGGEKTIVYDYNMYYEEYKDFIDVCGDS